MTNLNNKSERTEDQGIFEQEMGKWLRKTRLSSNLINPITKKSKFVSLSKLGQHLGVTFQQVQKYEKGRNCIGLYKFRQCCVFFNKCPRDVLEVVEVEVLRRKQEPFIKINEVSFADRYCNEKED